MNPTGRAGLDHKAPSRKSSRWTIGFGVLVAFGIVYVLQRVLIPFAVAGLLSYLLDPPISWSAKRLHIPRMVAVSGVYILILVPLSMLGYWLGPSLIDHAQRLVGDLPSMVDSVVRKSMGGAEMQLFGVKLQADSVTKAVMERLNATLGTPEGLARIGEYALHMAIGLILTLVLLFYLLVSPRSFIEIYADLVPADKRARLGYFVRRIDLVVGRYLRGLLLLIAFQFLVTWLVLELFFDLPGSIPLALVIGFLEPIPGIGPILAFLAAGTMAIALGGFWLMVKLLIFMGILRIVIDNIAGPLVLGWAVTLHPVLIIFALLAGVTLFGFLGLLIAVPVAASVKVLIDEWDHAPL